MIRALTGLLSFLLPCAAVAAQEIPGVRATLSARYGLFRAGAPVELRLLLTVDADTQIPVDLLTGVDLTVTVGDKPGPRIQEAGRGVGPVSVAKGTRIERTLSFPADRFVPNAGVNELAYVSVAWAGLAGASCVFKIAPDTKDLDIATLDLEKTKVVLVTNHGEMTVAFLPQKAPKTVENFLKLCASGFYDGTKFHRVLRNFMIQGGDPNSKDDTTPELWGRGDPGYKIDAEFNDTKHLRGTLSMARGQDPNSAGCQFFIVHKDSNHLDGQYTVFGNLESGMDTLDSIAAVETAGTDRPPSRPVQPVILFATIVLPVKK